jgi:uncharacterized heparinase superfamily protein
MIDRGPLLRIPAPRIYLRWAGISTGFLRRASNGFGLGYRSQAKIFGLNFPLQSLQTPRPALAADMAHGSFRLGGSTYTGVPAQVFRFASPNPAFTEALLNLSWLHHFCAEDNELHRLLARTLIIKWAERTRFGQSPATLSRALIALSLAAQFLVGNRPSPFAEPLIALVENLLRRVASYHPRAAEEQLLQSLGLLYASLAFRLRQDLRDLAIARFCLAINKVILPDGGHVSRNPAQLLATLLDLIPVKHGLLGLNLAVPQPLTAAIERMVPMLRMLSHGDQGLANFQGSGSEDTSTIRAILNQDKVSGRPLSLAPHSGYGRISHRSGLLLIDTGSAQACESPLAFEFSEGPHRLITNCGMPQLASPAWRQAAGDIAAHNTLELTDAVFTQQGNCSAEVLTSPRGSCLKAASTRIAGRSRLTHLRAIFLSQEGNDLRGEERLLLPEAAPDQAFILRFHLHPTTKASLIRTGGKIVLLLPNRQAWSFAVSGARLDLEESIYLGDPCGHRKSAQIVVRGKLRQGDVVRWALRRNAKASPSGLDPEAAPELPF